jgi:DNA-binding Xre family transcriptional regulator
MPKYGSFFGMYAGFCWKFYKFVANINNLLPMAKDINRIKVVLVEQKRTGKWLAEQMGKDQATVSKWCTNTSQPDLPTLTKVAEILNVDIKELLNSTKDT